MIIRYMLILFMLMSMNLIAQETHWNDIELRDNGGGSVIFGRNGAYLSSLPSNLSNKIVELQKEGKELRQISFGQDDSWVLLYGNDGAYWKGIPEALADKIKSKSKVNQVSILSNGGYVLINGSNGYSFDGIPKGLGDKIRELNQNKETIRKVTVNDNNQWVVLWGQNEANWGGNIPSGLVDKIKQYYNEGTKIRDVSLNNSGNWAILSGDSGWWGACSEGVKSILRKGRENIKSSNESSASNNISQSKSTQPAGVNVFKEMSDATVWAGYKDYTKQEIINRLIKLIEVGPIMSKEDSKDFNHGGPAWRTEHRLRVKARYQNNQIIITSSYTDNKQTKRGWMPSTKNFGSLIDFNKLKGVSMDDIRFERRDFVNGVEESRFSTSFKDGFKADEYGRDIKIYAPKGASNPELAKRYIWAISNL